MTDLNLGSMLASERMSREDWREPEHELPESYKSAANGRSHYFGRLYELGDPCVWCGRDRDDEIHLDAAGVKCEMFTEETLAGCYD